MDDGGLEMEVRCCGVVVAAEEAPRRRMGGVVGAVAESTTTWKGSEGVAVEGRVAWLYSSSVLHHLDHPTTASTNS